MGRNTSIWLKRSKKKFPSSVDAWVDIVAEHQVTRDRVSIAHSRYFWRWKVNSLKRRK